MANGSYALAWVWFTRPGVITPHTFTSSALENLWHRVSHDAEGKESGDNSEDGEFHGLFWSLLDIIINYEEGRGGTHQLSIGSCWVPSGCFTFDFLYVKGFLIQINPSPESPQKKILGASICGLRPEDLRFDARPVKSTSDFFSIPIVSKPVVRTCYLMHWFSSWRWCFNSRIFTLVHAISAIICKRDLKTYRKLFCYFKDTLYPNNYFILPSGPIRPNN